MIMCVCFKCTGLLWVNMVVLRVLCQLWACWYPCFLSLCCSSSPRGPSTSPSAHSISTPEKNRFPRGTTSRSTFHGAQLRDRRSATYNGPPASPTLSHDTGALTQQRRGTSTGIISKITSKFVRRSVKTNGCRNHTLGWCLYTYLQLTVQVFLWQPLSNIWLCQVLISQKNMGIKRQSFLSNLYCLYL